MSNLINRLFLELDQPDRSKTQLAFAANYIPAPLLSEYAKKLISWQFKKKLYKGQILATLNDDMTHMTYAPRNKHLQDWAINWAYNAIPTQIEWERKSTGYIIDCDFRVIANGAKIVLLSF